MSNLPDAVGRQEAASSLMQGLRATRVTYRMSVTRV